MIGWGPQQYVPIHDHPNGGCMVKVVKDPGFEERIYRRRQQRGSDIRNWFNTVEGWRRVGYTKRYDCTDDLCERRLDDCNVKNHGLHAWITAKHSFNATVGDVSTMIGHNKMHSVINPNSETTLSLHHYLGRYRLSWWLDPHLAYSSSQGCSGVKQRTP